MVITVKRIDRIAKGLDTVVTIMAEDTAELAAAKMRDHRIGCLVVLDADN